MPGSGDFRGRFLPERVIEGRVALAPVVGNDGPGKVSGAGFVFDTPDGPLELTAAYSAFAGA